MQPPEAVGIILSVARAIHHVRLCCSLNIAEDLISFISCIKVRIRVICEASHIAIEDDFKISVTWRGILINGLEAVIRHLIVLGPNVDIAILLGARDAKFARESAWATLCECLRPIALRAHHLARAAHCDASVR